MTKLNWLAYATTGKEFDVMDDLAALGVDHWRGVKIEFIRKGKNRTADPVEFPALPNYIWVMPTHGQVHLLRSVRHMAPTFWFLTDSRSGNCGASGGVGQMERFRADAEAKLAQARRVAGNREAIAEYKAGEALEIRDGAFAGELAKFTRLIQGANDLHPLILAEMTVMGRTVPIRLDPLSVRKAG